MMRILKRLSFFFSHHIISIIGFCFGITLSLIVMPIMEEKCSHPHLTQDRISDTKTSALTAIDEYEPVMHLDTKPKNVPRPEKIQIPRARYYSTELGIKEKLFIGVLSTPSTISSLGSALNKTLTKHANKILFFLEGADSENVDLSSNSIVNFPDKREILAPFNMLQYVSNNFLNDYDFFFFAKDTTHIRGKKLLEFVSHLSIIRDVHLGQPIEIDSLYCNLDAGILLSHSVLSKTVQNLDWCIQHTFSQSNSDNFGRCVLHGTDQSCSSEIQGLAYISHHVSKDDGLEASILKSSWPKDLRNVLTVYTVSVPEDHYLIHHHFCHQELIDNQHELQEIQVKISDLNAFFPENVSRSSWPVGIEPPFKPHGRFDVLPWIYFNNTHKFLETELKIVSEIKGSNKLEIHDLLKSAVQWVKITYQDKYIYQSLVNGYKRFDPTRGTEYILDMLFLDETTGLEILKRISAVRPLNQVEIIPVPFVTEHTRVVLLVTVKASERNEALRFLDDYVKTCIEKQDSTVMLLVFLYGPQDPGKGEKEDVFGPLKDMVSSYVNKYRSNGAKIAWFSVKTIGKMPPYFALVDLVSRKLSSDSLMLLCHIGMEIHTDYINRVRMNTILKTQVFFPIPFRQYHPALAYNHVTLPDNVEIKKDLGHFDTESYEHASFYLSDYLVIRKQLENTIPMIKTDKDLKNELLYTSHLDLFEIFVQSKLHVMRGVEPDLRIRFKFDMCDLESNVATYQECLHIREQNLGTKSQMAAQILSHADHDNKDSIQLSDIL
ncbi:chondroitin sulfate synthase 2 [Parasteatoda tepidariorum]|uniref:chondroitin sulfate synthase 2 n=1 Tax=Parasteatoda tepidariorum TaxID=114398 RepID=UPI00077FA236|nr:chondroitin sulfate synthase 2-like [Parasteatoda tepidariorum]